LFRKINYRSPSKNFRHEGVDVVEVLLYALY
jgi:hypothetical protein